MMREGVVIHAILKINKFNYEIILSIRGGVVRTIMLNHPHNLNAINQSLVDDVARVFDDANADLPPPVVRAMKRVLNRIGIPDLYRALQLQTEVAIAGCLSRKPRVA